MNGEARQTIARLATETLPRLIERLTNSDLGELEVREDGWRIRLRKPTSNGLDAGEAAALAQPDSRVERTVSAKAASGQRAASQRPPSQGVVTSPAVGYFAPRDGMAVGLKVSRGDVLGHVDVLGVRQEVVAPQDGVISAVDVQAGQAIEFGEPVARIDTASMAPVEA